MAREGGIELSHRESAGSPVAGRGEEGQLAGDLGARCPIACCGSEGEAWGVRGGLRQVLWATGRGWHRDSACAVASASGGGRRMVQAVWQAMLRGASSRGDSGYDGLRPGVARAERQRDGARARDATKRSGAAEKAVGGDEREDRRWRWDKAARARETWGGRGNRWARAGARLPRGEKKLSAAERSGAGTLGKKNEREGR